MKFAFLFTFCLFGLSTLRADELAPSKEILPAKWKPSIAPNPRPDAQWFRSAAFGIFQHWGIVSGSERGEAWDMRVRMQWGGKEVPGADSEKIIPEGHSCVSHPETMAEVRRILTR